MDPIGFGLQHFDWMGRMRETEDNGQPVDASGTMPSGERFSGPQELRKVLLDRKDDFVGHVAGKVLGFAIGRGLEDGDQCTVQRLNESLKQHDYSARTLIRGVVLSEQFRNTQGVEMSRTSAPVNNARHLFKKPKSEGPVVVSREVIADSIETVVGQPHSTTSVPP